MKRTTVNGETYEVLPLREGDVAPGALVCGAHVRKAYRVLVRDGGEWVLRDMRHPHIVDIADEEWILANCERMVPARR